MLAGLVGRPSFVRETNEVHACDEGRVEVVLQSEECQQRSSFDQHCEWSLPLYHEHRIE